MTNTFRYLLLLLVFNIGCEPLKDMAVIGIPLSLEQQFQVANTEKELSFNESIIIDATLNGDVAENIDNIKEYQVKSIHYLVTNPATEGDSVVTHATISFSSIDTNEVVVYTHEDINLNELETPNEEQEIEYTDEQLTAIGEMLKSGNQINVEYIADIDTVASYTYKVIIDLSLKVGI